MWSTVQRRLVDLVKAARRPSAPTLLGLAALIVAGYVVVYPFCVVTYPPITDLPFHAAEASILRHYFDPSFHFREQFSLHPLDAPYVSMYVIGAAFALVLPAVAAAKAMTIVMLALLPLGLAVMFYGMKKSPLWGLLGLEPVWSTLTHWGFLNFVGAIGLFAMAIGFTLLVLDRPTRARIAWLTAVLVAIFFTHIYRFPFAVAAVVGTTIVMYPATRRIRPIVVPVAVSGAIFAAWRLIRRPLLSSSVDSISWHWERTSELMSHLFGGYADPTEQNLARWMLWSTLALFAVAVGLFFLQGRHRARSGRELWWAAGVSVLPLLIAFVYFGCYYMLPMTIGIWWFVYPREALTALFMMFGAFPDMPRQWWLKAPIVGVLAILTGRLALYNAEQWNNFETVTADFRAISGEVPFGSKLMYLVFDHSGSTRSNTPFIHLPAWIQAERGGWLSFHFVGWDLHPIRYRENEPSVPPPRPPRWEWTPERFQLEKDAPWFDTFLVRSRGSPDYLFATDSSIKPVDHQGTWWLYRKN